MLSLHRPYSLGPDRYLYRPCMGDTILYGGPHRRFVFQTEISGNYIVLVLISRLFYFLSSLRRGDQSAVFCIVSFDFN